MTDKFKLTFEDLVSRNVGFDELLKLKDFVSEDDLRKYCDFQDQFSARILAEFKARGAPETATVREVLTEADLKVIRNGTLERVRSGAALQ